ncbi:MAG: KOW domain-containing RNA-binding protein [Limnochordales bacterium]|nr:KOW domain-containing RNA-binding protein [Limnochordales bacterium]
MMAARIAVGQVVTSRAGRDAGRTYLVVGVRPDGRVLVADGRIRPLERPKVKNPRHLWIHRTCFRDPFWVADDLHVREALALWAKGKGLPEVTAREDRATEERDDCDRKGGC